MRRRGKSRTNWRRCQICKKANEPVLHNPMIYVCSCVTRSVHYNCQAEMMVETGIIYCSTCNSRFVGVQYQASHKNFLQYIWESTTARGSLITTFSMLLSMFFTVATLMRTYFFDLEGLLEEAVHFEWSMEREAIKHDISIVMMVHAKLFLPVLSIYLTVHNVCSFIIDFWQWQKDHFNVTINPPNPQIRHMTSHGGKTIAST